ncbi:hypothetical protein OM416_20275 [Paenibacillus sp. LS1]|uniref:hypothetical protein n=1 Tax=Paenibacillus sp. LS1 TaxID=2992120 RepID=UPI002231C2C6|nr:hypothetical protein [Paenibacillus sp. LS1]MCW3793934.1 hypothetical protein [Paenibacillus sp. LS1]
MKITNFAVLAIIIILPFIIINTFNIEAQKKALFLETRYNAAIDAATQDATLMLLNNASQGSESLYESAKNVRVNKEAAAEAFFQTMYLNFDVQDDPYAQGTLNRYVPALVVIGYDGYYILSEKEFADATGQKALKHVWSVKKPYSYKDEKGNLISFTLDDYVTMFDPTTKELKKGYLFDVNSDSGQKFVAEMWNGNTSSLIQDPKRFDTVRRSTIVSLIQQDLQYEINKHNTLVKRYGVTYTFTLPSIDQEEWNNTVDDVGVLSFVQGIPVGTEYYNNYALGGARIIQKPSIVGITANGIKYYYDRTACKSSYVTEETFTSKKEAAQEGYHPLSCSNK